MIVTAFAQGDRKSLKDLLSREVYEGFERAIVDRDKRGEKVETTFVSIDKADIVGVEVRNRVAQVTIRFLSKLITVTRDAQGNVVDGSPDSGRRRDRRVDVRARRSAPATRTGSSSRPKPGSERGETRSPSLSPPGLSCPHPPGAPPPTRRRVRQRPARGARLHAIWPAGTRTITRAALRDLPPDLPGDRRGAPGVAPALPADDGLRGPARAGARSVRQRLDARPSSRISSRRSRSCRRPAAAS